MIYLHYSGVLAQRLPGRVVVHEPGRGVAMTVGIMQPDAIGNFLARRYVYNSDMQPTPVREEIVLCLFVVCYCCLCCLLWMADAFSLLLRQVVHQFDRWAALHHMLEWQYFVMKQSQRAGRVVMVEKPLS